MRVLALAVSVFIGSALPVQGEEDEVLRAIVSSHKGSETVRSAKDWLAIATELKSVVRRHPESRHRHWARATAAACLVVCGEYAKAEATLRMGLSDPAIPPDRHAQLEVALADVLITKGDVEAGLKQLESAKQFVYDRWLKLAGGQGPEQTGDVERSDKASSAVRQITAFAAHAWPVWQKAGRLDLLAGVYLDLAESQRGLMGSHEESVRRRATDVASNMLRKAGDWLLQAGDRDQARLVFEEALPLTDSLGADNAERIAALRFIVGIRAAWLRSDREDARRLLQVYARRYWMPLKCLNFADHLPASDRLDFLREVLSLLPADYLPTSTPVDEGGDPRGYERLLYKLAMNTASELGLDDEAAKYAGELAERYPGSNSSPGLFGALEGRLRSVAPAKPPTGRRPPRTAADRTVAAPSAPVPSAVDGSAPRRLVTQRQADRRHLRYEPPAEKATAATPRVRETVPASPTASQAARPSSQPAQAPSAATRIADPPIRQEPPRPQSAEDTPHGGDKDAPAPAASWDTSTLAIAVGLATIVVGIIAYIFLRAKSGRAT